MIRKITLYFSLVLSTSLMAYDDDDILLSCAIDKDKITQNYTTHLKDLQKLAIEAAPVLCKHALQLVGEDVEAIKNTVYPFAKQARKAMLETFPDKDFSGALKFSDAWRDQVFNFQQDSDYLNVVHFIEHDDPDDSKDTFTFQLAPYETNFGQLTLTPKMKNICKNVPRATKCELAGDSLNNAIKPAFIPYQKVILEGNGKKLGKLQNQWSSFMKESRYQFPWEVWATTIWYREKFNSPALVGPPEAQVILFHPTIVVEHINDASKGDRDDVSLGFEWIGANWWKTGIGLSFTSVYKDRDNISTVGTGFTVHIKNKYSVGWVKRSDGNDSIFFNVDLGEWFIDAKEKYKKYQRYF